MKEESVPRTSGLYRRVYNYLDAPTAPDLQLDWLSSSDSEESDVGVEVLYMYKNGQPQNPQQEQQSGQTSQSSSVQTSQNNTVAVVDLTQEETDDESHPIRQDVELSEEPSGNNVGTSEVETVQTPPHAIKEEVVATSSRSRDEGRQEGRTVTNVSSPGPGPSRPPPPASPSPSPPCSSSMRVPYVNNPYVSYPVAPPIAHSSQFYQRMPACRYHTTCSSSETSVSEHNVLDS